MKRTWTNIKVYEPQILHMRNEGKTRQEIADALGLKKEQIKEWIKRYNRRQKDRPVLTKRRGRPRKMPLTTQNELELRIKELEREVDLYKSFLRVCGRM